MKIKTSAFIPIEAIAEHRESPLVHESKKVGEDQPFCFLDAEVIYLTKFIF